MARPTGLSQSTAGVSINLPQRSSPQARLLAWCSTKLAAAGKQARVLVWDTASWQRSHHQRGTAGAAGVRRGAWFLPRTSPWRNPLAPAWVHAKPRVRAADRLLTAAAVEQRVCATLSWLREDHLMGSATGSC